MANVVVLSGGSALADAAIDGPDHVFGAVEDHTPVTYVPGTT